jgi:pimeloyl-ACP methyl ester carboxylesterase
MPSASIHVRALAAAGAALACAAAALPAWAQASGDYQIIAAESAIVGHHLTRTAATVQVGSDPLNRFEMVRVVRAEPPAHAQRGTILLLPPISAGFQNYEATADGDYAESFVAFFADRGYDVWGLSQRTQYLAAGACESGAADCTAMGSWGMATLLDDAGFVRAQIEAAHPGEKPAVGGVSLGSMAGIALIDAHPEDYAGAIFMEGAIYDADPADQAIAQGFCGLFDSLLSVGVYYDGQQLPGLKLLAQLATVDPRGPSPVPGFPAGFTNHQVFVGAMSAPGVGPLTPRPGYYFLAGDAQQDRFFYADDALARANVLAFVDYTALRMIRDVDCGLAGETTFTSRLADYHGPVFVNAGGHGFGPALLDTVERMTNARLTVNYVEAYGHMDHFFAADQRHVLEEPLLAWLRDEVFRR